VVLAGVVVLAASLLGSVAAEAKPLFNEHYCDGCKPPLTYNGGRVLSTASQSGVTVTPIYWAPPEAGYAFPADYVSLINGYIANVAAASNTDTNVYSINTEYYDLFGGQPNHVKYNIKAGTPIVHRRPLPTRRCKPTNGGTGTCITEAQLLTELRAVVKARHLPVGLAHFYPVFIPPGVETKGTDGDSSATTYCAWHTYDTAGGGTIIYGNEPYPEEGCIGPQSPNHNPTADAAIDTLSHEINEAITDPLLDAWQDEVGSENADICANNYGPPLGFSDPQAPETTGYNQVINGGLYSTQTEFSNSAYRKFGVGMGCQQSESAVRRPSEPTGDDVAHVDFAGIYPEALSADGRSVASLAVAVSDAESKGTPGDRIFFTTHVGIGTGKCGKVTPQTADTDKDGVVYVTYRASRSDVACVIVANEALGGKSVAGVIYQGKARSKAPALTAAYPKVLVAGRTTTFAMKLANRTKHKLVSAQVLFGISPPRAGSPVVQARQLQLSVSRSGPRGPFVPVDLGGSLAGGGSIVGLIGGEKGFDVPSGRTSTLTFRLRATRGAPRGRRSILQFQSVLEQVNPATGASAQLGYTNASNARIR
jgi:hypothetical protein